MEKKKYSTNQQFIVIYAINSRKKLCDRFTIEKIDSVVLRLYDTIIDKNGELSDGEVALALSDSLNNIYSDCSSNTQVTLVNWWAI
jgi:predicted transcriptional regulator